MVCLLQAAYGQEMVAQHGNGFNWRGAPVDAMTCIIAEVGSHIEGGRCHTLTITLHDFIYVHILHNV
jgi:hypothetical protein